MVRKICVLVLALSFLLMTGIAVADSVTLLHYVYQDWVGEYTGQVDSNNIPFGFGVFVSETKRDNELWHYIGGWEDGLPEGDGAIYFENASMLKGTFKQGELVDGMKYSVSGMSAVPIKTTRSISTDDEEVQFVGNKKSLRFHLPTCRAVNQMSEKNKVFFSSREEAIENHYIPCGECNP